MRVESISLADTWAKAGLMARTTIAADSAFAATLATPSSGNVSFTSRLAPGAAAARTGSFPVNYPYTYVRLKRVGNVFTGYGSWDGENWEQVGTLNASGAPATWLVGFAVTSHSTGAATARIQDFMEVTGGTIGSV